MNDALFKSSSFEWKTPQWLFDALNKRFTFTLDVCATPHNALCDRYFTIQEDGLSVSWKGERCYMNPPYGRDICKWVNKANMEAKAGALVVGLLPARTDTNWWQQYVQGHADIRFISGRLKFSGSNNSAPFPSAIAIWWGWPVLDGSLFCNRLQKN